LATVRPAHGGRYDRSDVSIAFLTPTPTANRSSMSPMRASVSRTDWAIGSRCARSACGLDDDAGWHRQRAQSRKRQKAKTFSGMRPERLRSVEQRILRRKRPEAE
jgi:hypothetical protein